MNRVKWNVSFLMLLIVTICLVSCNLSSGSTHEHTYSSEWSSDAEYHWHQATCEHVTEINGKAAHTFDGKTCKVCKYTKQGTEVEKVFKEVTFNVNGGNENLEAMQFAVGEVMATLPSPTKDGYKFVCWQSAGGEEWTAASVMPDYNLQLTAKWEKILTGYSDDYVSFMPASSGYKNILYYETYKKEVDQFVYVEITSDDLLGKVGESNNFNLRTLDGMEYKVSSGYTWSWYQGSFSSPNGAQQFHLNYGSNLQFVTVSDSSGVVRQTYLLDIYVRHDYYISLYKDKSEYKNQVNVKPYKTVRVIENDLFEPKELDIYNYGNGIEFDKHVYYNNETGKFENFIYSTTIHKDWDLYQTYKPVTLSIDVGEEGSLTIDNKLVEEITVTPFEDEFVLAIPQKPGYTFIGWQGKNNVLITDKNGYATDSYLSSKNLTETIKALYTENRYSYVFRNEKLETQKHIPYIEYTDKTNTRISKIFYYKDDVICLGDELLGVGDSITVTTSKNGYAFDGWYEGTSWTEGATKVSSDFEFTMDVRNQTWSYVAKWVEVEVNTDHPNSQSINMLSDVYKVGQMVTISIAHEYLGYTFKGWYDDETLISVESSYTFTIPQEGFHYIAKWEKDEKLNGFEFTSDANTCTITGASSSMTEAVLPNYVTSIADEAFKNHTSLTTISFSTNLISIGKESFSGCKNLKNFELPSNLERINQSAFLGCSSLTSIIIPDSVTNIGKSMLSGCSSLKNLTLPILNKTSEMGALGYIFGATSNSVISRYVPASLDEVTITKDKALPANAFYNCINLTTIHLPNELNSIGESAFYNCKNLTSFVVPNGVESIGKSAFNTCTNLQNITISSTVKEIGMDVFNSCSSLENVYYFNSLEDWCNVSFENQRSNPMSYASHFYLRDNNSWEEVINIELLDATEIGQYSFYGFNNVTSVTISNDVTSIGERAFENCSSLTKATMPILAIPYIPKTKLQEVVLTGGTSLESKAFYQCSSLTSIELPEELNSIGEYAFFDCINLQSIRIPSGVVKFETSILDHCTNLKDIYLANGVKEICYSVFNYCNNLLNIYYEGSIEEWCEIHFYEAMSQPMYFGKHFFMKNEIGDWEEVTDIILPRSVSQIKKYAFYGFVNLVSIILHDQITSIGERAFLGCSNLEKITIPGSVRGSIGERALASCTNLRELELLSGITVLPKYLLSGCVSLTEIQLPESVIEIKDYVFKDCSSLTSIVMPQSIKFGTSCFENVPSDSFICYYRGGAIADFANVNVGSGNSKYINPSQNSSGFYYYVETTPTTTGKFWHYVDGAPAKWD